MAPSSLRSLISSPGHANMLRFFPYSGGRVGAVLPAKPYFFAAPRQHAPGFPGRVAGHVGAVFPANPYFFAAPRQQPPCFPGRSPAVLAPSFLRSLISSPGHANMLRFFPYSRRLCWRRPPCEALFLRRATPTCSGFSCIAGGFVGAVLPAKPYFFAGSRQHAPVSPV